MPDSQPDQERNPGSPPEEERNLGSLPESEATAEDVSDGSDTADSSTAEEGGDLLSAMKNALDGSEDAEQAPDSGSGQEETPDGEAAAEGESSEEEAEPTDDPTEEELNRYNPRTRKRVEKLLNERREATRELEAVKPKAEQFDRIVSYIGQRNLNIDDVNNIFEIGALVKNNPVEALQRVEPIYQQLRQMAGETLPQDLEERVRLGYTTREDALQVSRARAAQMQSQQEAERIRHQTEAQRQQHQQQQHVEAIRGAVTDWESQKAGSDPDWKLKSDRVTELIELELHRNGMPRSPQEATAMADRAYERATKEIQRLAPKKQEVKPVTGQTSENRSAQPASMEEAMQQALGR